MAAKTQKTKEPETMEELLAATGYQVRGFKRGQTVTGRVVSSSGGLVLIDIGGKAEAVVAQAEMELGRDYFRSMKPGDEVTGVVVVPETDAGQVVLSLRQAAVETGWKIFGEALEEDRIVSVVGREVARGGLLVDGGGIYGFIPTSQLSREYEVSPEALVGKQIKVKVVEVDKSQNRLILSERAVTEAEEIEARRKALSEVKVGGEYEGTVVGMVPFGVFVSVAVDRMILEGLVHISEISWEKVEDVVKVVKAGDKVKVKVIGVDEADGKLALSMKRLTTDPWLAVASKYPVDSKHIGTVVRIVPYGVLVRLERGIEGLIHVSKMPAGVSFEEGQEVEVFVELVDLDKRRLSLGVVVKETGELIYK